MHRPPVVTHPRPHALTVATACPWAACWCAWCWRATRSSAPPARGQAGCWRARPWAAGLPAWRATRSATRSSAPPARGRDVLACAYPWPVACLPGLPAWRATRSTDPPTLASPCLSGVFSPFWGHIFSTKTARTKKREQAKNDRKPRKTPENFTVR